MLNTHVPQTSTTKKILIVEDEGEVCLLLNLLLDGEDMELDHVKYLKDAVGYLEKEKPAVIILDNKLPDGYGVDFIRYIKQNLPQTKVMMISGFDASVEDVALENGADLFIQKPFTGQQIRQSVKEMLKEM
jgi:two-component system, OmpR family, response regulator